MTKAQLEEQLAEAYQARNAILQSQEYTLSDGRRLKRADLAEVNSLILSLERKLSNSKGLRMRKVIPNGV